MKTLLLIVMMLTGLAGLGQVAGLGSGVSVELGVAPHGVAVWEAEDPQAAMVTVTADGQIYLQALKVALAELEAWKAETVYLKVDRRAGYESVLRVLDVLRRRSVVLMSQVSAEARRESRVPPYGMRMKMER